MEKELNLKETFVLRWGGVEWGGWGGVRGWVVAIYLLSVMINNQIIIKRMK